MLIITFIRGSPHYHCLLWLDGAPKFDPDCPESFQICSSFAEELISCDITESGIYTDFQLHRHTHTCYRSEKDKVMKKCRFDLPMFPLDRTMILSPLNQSNCSSFQSDLAKAISIKEFLRLNIDSDQHGIQEQFQISEDQYLRAIRCYIKRTRLFMKRKSGSVMVNNFNPTVLAMHRSNMDIQFILDPYAVCSYVVNYINKSSKSMSKLLRTVAEQAKSETSNLDKLRKISYAFLDSQEVSVQEAVYMMLSMHFKECSRGSIFIASFPRKDRHRLLKSVSELNENDDELFVPNVFDHYESRPQELEGKSLAEFATEYEFSRLKHGDDDNAEQKSCLEVKLRKSRRILRCVGYQESIDPDNFYREQILLYMPWRNEVKDIDEVNQKMVYTKYKDKILSIRSIFTSLTIQELEDRMSDAEYDEVPPADNEGIRDEDFVLCLQNPVKMADIEENVIVQEKLKVFNSPKLLADDSYEELIYSLNEGQRHYLYDIVNKYRRCVKFNHFLSGAAGVGKSKLIDAIFQTITRMSNKKSVRTESTKVLVTASTGKAAFNIQGDTIHHAFSLPVNQFGGKLPQLSESVSNSIACQLYDIELIIIDEISMVGTRTLSYINQRLKQVMKSDEVFGGVSIIVVGDLKQLPPVGDSPIFKADPKDPYSFIINKSDSLLWRNFKLFELTEIMRQKDDKSFALALRNLGNDSLTQVDTDLIDSRIVKVNPCDDQIHLFYANKDVENYNNTKLELLYTQKFVCDAHDCITGATTQKQMNSAKINFSSKKTSDTYGLPSKLTLKIEARYTITVNIDTADGLTNGCTGQPN